MATSLEVNDNSHVEFDEWFHDSESDSEDKEEVLKNSRDELFYFETDDPALKENSDYHKLLKTLCILQAQRVKAIKDVERLELLRLKVMKDPIGYLERFARGETLSDFPSRTEVVKIPEIDWSKYSVSSNMEEPSMEEKAEAEKEEEEYVDKCMLVRGKVYDPSKPKTFNQLWRPEEQIRLEELLEEFPPEKNSNNRWRKIAQALGNRTTKQVCSRVQKYFQKLKKAGLPIPGNQLKTSTILSVKKSRRPRKNKNPLDSTFFPIYFLGGPEFLEGCDDEEEDFSVPPLTEEFKREVIKKIISYKEKDDEVEPFYHQGVICELCLEKPLQGTRWRCLECDNVSLCSNCVIDQLKSKYPRHPTTHHMEPLENPKLAIWDQDYNLDAFRSTNYLDPNFASADVL
uniref:ZZ-type zinc finger-containing protein 3 n=1 Tax=Graphocephala atropunctata TaxID=36148 RepID=A0A1B6KSG1_9HEMI